MDSRDWMPVDLARYTGITLAQVTRVLKGEQSPGNKFLLAVAQALEIPQTTVFHIAGVLTDQEIEDVREDEAARKVRRLLDALEPEERERAIRLLEQYVRDHRRVAPKARPARGEA
ncbi:MAG: helix-turn-helix transcriptional regulator [Chloroflexi bacterium]|nr:helix-turn-helix transcriptional regulator [Chloroflexota bacterium]